MIAIESVFSATDPDTKKGIITFSCPHDRRYLLRLRNRAGKPHSR